ncbi:MAG: ketopantoate reductase family protein [Thermoplasmata archaeon]|nr:2-dehydropantoate 2-reductase [Thermoplasmata archaeon]
MNVVVVGAGAVGSLFGGRLAAAGSRVTLVARPGHVRAIREGGLRIEGTSPGTWPLEATSDLSAAGPADAVLVTVKTFDLEAAARELGRTLPPTPTLLPQNGLGIVPPVLDALRTSGWARPEDWVVRAVQSVPALWIGPGIVRASGTGEVILPDPGGRGPLAGPIERFQVLLRGAGFTVRTSADIDREVWRKALVNAAINPVTALHGVPNGRLIDGPLRSEAVALLTEARTVARAEGFVFGEAEAESDLDRVVLASAENRSSMLQDIDRGRPTEIDAISGELLRLGAVNGLDLPHTRAACVAVRARAARPQA